jgi:hypothetical protein
MWKMKSPNRTKFKGTRPLLPVASVQNLNGIQDREGELFNFSRAEELRVETLNLQKRVSFLSARST